MVCAGTIICITFIATAILPGLIVKLAAMLRQFYVNWNLQNLCITGTIQTVYKGSQNRQLQNIISLDLRWSPGLDSACLKFETAR
jgi:hypothetical protein